LDSSGSEKGKVAKFCEHGTEPPAFKEFRISLDQLCSCQLLRHDSALCS